MTPKYFFGTTKGLNADIERHREKERELVAKLNSLAGKTDDQSKAALRTYSNLLNKLQQSKAEILTQLGKKK